MRGGMQQQQQHSTPTFNATPTLGQVLKTVDCIAEESRSQGEEDRTLLPLLLKAQCSRQRARHIR